MTKYIVTGHSSTPSAPPYSFITNLMSVGQTIDLILSAQDEATLTAAGMIQRLVASSFLTPSGGDDSAAMAAALTNFAPFAYPTIQLSHGTFLWNTQSVPVPRNTPAVIQGAGKFATTIKLSASAPRAFDFSSQLVANSSVTGTLNSTNQITGISGSQTNFQNGMLVSHSAFPYGTTLVSGAGTTTWTTSAPANTSASGQTILVSDLFTGLQFKGFTVDANNVQSKDSVILGSKEGGNPRFYVNCRDIDFEDLRTINVPSVVTTGDYTQATSSRNSIWLTCYHHNYNEPLNSIMVRCKARRCEFLGGDTGIFIAGSGGQAAQTGTTNQLTSFTATAQAGAGLAVGQYFYRLVALDTNGFPCLPTSEVTATATGTNGQIALAWTIPGGSSIGSISIYRGTSQGWYNQTQSVSAATVAFTDSNAGWTNGLIPFRINCYCDDLDADQIYHSPDPAEQQVPTQFASGAGVQFISRGFGGAVSIRNCRVYGSTDAAFEIDACHQAYFQNNKTLDCTVDTSLYLNSFSWPNEPMSIIIKEFRTRISSQATVGGLWSSPLKINPAGGGPAPASVRIENYRHLSLSASLPAAQGFATYTSACPRVELIDASVEAPNVNLAAPSTNFRAFLFGSNFAATEAAITQRIICRNVHCAIGGLTNSNSVSGACLIGIGAGKYVLDWDEIRSDFNLAGVAIHSIYNLDFTVANNTITEGRIKGYHPTTQGDTGTPAGSYAFHITGGTSITRRVKFIDTNFSDIPGTSATFPTMAVGQTGKMYAGEGFVPQSGYPMTPYAITPAASGAWTQHAEGMRGKLIFTGGTGTAVKFSPDNGVNNYFHWQVTTGQAFDAVGGPAELEIDPGDYWEITYTVVPTVTFKPSRY
jgi:hypothetical protein